MTTQPVRGPGWRPDDSTFGTRIAMVRQSMGWGNVKEAALACGLPVESWRNWQRDGRMPRDYMAVCAAIARRTDVDLSWLAGLPRLDSNQQPAGTGTHPPISGETAEYRHADAA